MESRRPRLLAVEDERDILDLLLMTFTAEGFEATGAEDGLSGLEKCVSLHPDILILDLMLPRLDGLELCRRLRHDGRFRQLPIIMLTARAEEADRLKGFETGADDYVVKPFSFKELVMRARALLRRSGAVVSGGDSGRREEAVMRFGSLEIDHAARRVTFKGREISLTATEYKLLYYLAGRPGLVVERGQLLEEVWGYQEDSYARTIDTHMRRLRQKLGEAEVYLETIRGVGYRFKLS
ncbi:DNA-binding response regulator [Deltaproteobacteria bacterium Smac51]|nr:DNA-binding response regulator [Deltaproteobacteria bacterium Smac51]